MTAITLSESQMWYHIVWLLVLVSLVSISALWVGTNVAEAGVEDNSPCWVEITMPRVLDVTGRAFDTLVAGQQVVVAATLTNHCEKEVPFVALFEVRDTEGVSVALKWATGQLNADGQYQTGVSWVPEEPGDYELRAFAITNFTNPEILTLVGSSQVEIG